MSAEGTWNPVQVQGKRSDRSRPIDSVDDSGTERLAVDAKVSGIAEVNLDETNDEVAVYGGVDGSETADASTRQIINVDPSGRVRTDSTLQVADSDASTSNPVPARLSDGTDTANITAAGELNVIATAQPGVDIGDVTVNNASGASAVNIQDGGNSITVDQSTRANLNANATLQIAGTDAPGNAGASTASTPRTVTASDSPDVTALQVIDDWDESDRAKVNPIVGQAGVQGGAGTVSANTQRVAIATDANTVAQSTHDNFNANANIQVGNADVANGNPVPVSDAGGSLTVDGSVTVTQATASSLNAQVVGDVAHDGVDSGNPVKQGGKAIAHGTNPTAVAANDRTDWNFSRAGIPWVIGGHPNVQTIRANYTTAQTNAAIITVGAGTKIVVTRVEVTLDEAATVGVQFRIGFATATTPTTTGVISTHPGLVPGSIYQAGDGSGMLGVGADNEDVRITSEVPTGGSLDVVVSWYEVPS